MADWKASFVEEWQKRQVISNEKKAFFPLIEQTFDPEDVLVMAEVLLSGQLTMSKNVREFEKEFAAYVKSPFAVMVNSGSSANLLALAVATNPMRERRLKPGDEVLVPAVCWSTSVWPLFQFDLKPVFVDVDPKTLNVDIADLKNKITSKTKGFLAVHVLGNSAPMAEVEKIVKEHDLILIEDTCESLGSRAHGTALGCIGEFGTYSFYYSHHMTTGEGGMVTCRAQADYELLKCLRAHGWSRELSNRPELEKAHPDIDPRFLFVNVGYNLRPMEVQAALGRTQIKKLDKMNSSRVANRTAIIDALKAHPKWANQIELIEAPAGTEPIWFGFCALLAPKYANRLTAFLTFLTSKGIENRPVVSGNFARQPALRLMGLQQDPEALKGAEAVHHRGFFIGSHTELLSADRVKQLVETLMGFEF